MDLSNTSSPNFTTSNTRSNDVIVAVYYMIICTIGILLHLLVYIGILKAHEYKIKTLPPFYILLSNLYLADAVKLLLYLSYVSPSIFAGHILFPDWLPADFEGQTYSTIVMSTFLLSVNRALTIENNGVSKKLFKPRLCLGYALASWILGTLFVMGDELMHCAHRLDLKRYVFFVKCKYMESSATDVTNSTNYFWTYGVIAFYLRALYVLHKTRSQSHSTEAERRAKAYQIRLFLQALAVWLGLIANSLTFRLVMRYVDGLYFSIAHGIFVLGQAYITPVCMLVFVRKVRRCTWRIITREKIDTTSVHAIRPQV